jgi:hypothetical protein
VGNIDTSRGALVTAAAIRDIDDSISNNAKETSFERDIDAKVVWKRVR